ncbi:outer membrane lipoprotein carrier protein LolA [Dyella sp. BiH032]|uniref:LolA family protein n=1 Tax=Dyella sp. BiH032 TaxID=3075430 RepID=UPI0028933A39|nr:outer membrane lipoprotein carrier protein LolA [Dyella sp. BiH032]WNL44981.1 outer membrane lipoprotein carrier protein LolA [Dyella sp. BiH032]
MRRLIAVLLGWCAALVAHAQSPDLLRQVLDELSTHAAVRADFTQTRENPALAQPQTSTGKLLFVLGRGMLWQIEAPYRETLALAGERTARVGDDGRPQAARGDRGVAQVSQMLQGMLSGKPDEALRQFDVRAEGSRAQWTLHFTPRQARMARVLRRIELRGGEYLEGIAVELESGESTRIQFADTREAGPLSPLEKRALGMPP